ncbi:histidine acid phosphatase, partial [Ostertagia ostertagi]
MQPVNSIYLLLLVAPITTAVDSNQLISAIVLFRHGARAPTDKLSNDTFQQYFPNGLGELTDAGIESSFELGKFLRSMYVETGFLKDPLLPAQVYFRSRANSRCLMTAALVGRGMFNSAERLIGAPVPVYSQVKGDYFTEYQGFVYECLKLHKRSKIFLQGNHFQWQNSLINEHQNGLPMAGWFNANKDEVYRSFAKVDNFIVGSGEYHDPAVLRLKCGFLLHTIFKHLETSWETFYTQGCLDRKNRLVAWQSLMDAIGIRWAAVRQFAPTYNSMIILELRKVNDQPVIKVCRQIGFIAVPPTKEAPK